MMIGKVMMMVSKSEIKARIDFWQESLTKMRKAYLELVDGGVQSYQMEDRRLTCLDTPALLKQIQDAEKKVDELTVLLSGRKPRRAFGIVPMDW